MAERGYEELLSTAEGDDAVTEDWYRDDYESKSKLNMIHPIFVNRGFFSYRL